MWSVQTGVSLAIPGEVCVQEGPALTLPGQWVPQRTITMMQLFEEPALQEDTQRGQACYACRTVRDTRAIFN